MSHIISGQDPHSNSGTWPEGVAKPPPPDDEKLQALRWARGALGEAYGRCGMNRSDAFKTWTAAVEGVWWTLALDDSLKLLMGAELYQDLRDNDQHGRVVKGFKWIRNRHAHELFVTGAGGPKRNFFAEPGDDYVFYISPDNRWKRSADIRADHDQDTSGKLKHAYDESVAGLPLDMSLDRSLTWYNRLFDAWGIPDFVAVDDPTVLK